jgi:hypothetical protein
MKAFFDIEFEFEREDFAWSGFLGAQGAGNFHPFFLGAQAGRQEERKK